jgi:hypothetical protein
MRDEKSCAPFASPRGNFRDRGRLFGQLDMIYTKRPRFRQSCRSVLISAIIRLLTVNNVSRLCLRQLR